MLRAHGNACALPLSKYVVTAYKVDKRGKVVLIRTFTAAASAHQLEMKLPGRRSWVFTVTAYNGTGASTASARSNKVVAR